MKAKITTGPFFILACILILAIKIGMPWWFYVVYAFAAIGFEWGKG